MLNRPLFEIFSLSPTAESDITLTCDDCFAILDYFVDLVIDGFTLEEIKKPLLHHMNHCPDCREHYLQRINEIEEQLKQRRNEE